MAAYCICINPMFNASLKRKRAIKIERMILILVITMAIIAFFMARPNRGRTTAQRAPVKHLRVVTTVDQQRQLHKVHYQSDADRIRELNLLSPNAGKFMRLLLQIFRNQTILVKQQRFFVVASNGLPLAIFEYHDGQNALKTIAQEDGLPLFMYTALWSSQALQEDAKQIFAAQSKTI